jgi:hypothetical protein
MRWTHPTVHFRSDGYPSHCAHVRISTPKPPKPHWVHRTQLFNHALVTCGDSGPPPNVHDTREDPWGWHWHAVISFDLTWHIQRALLLHKIASGGGQRIAEERRKLRGLTGLTTSEPSDQFGGTGMVGRSTPRSRVDPTSRKRQRRSIDPRIKFGSMGRIHNFDAHLVLMRS